MTQARPSGGSSKQQPAEKINAKSRLFANENLPAPARTRGSSLPSLSPHPPFPLQSSHVALHLLRPSFQDSPHHRQKDRRRDERGKGRPAKRESQAPCKAQLGAVSGEERPVRRLIDSVSISLPGPRDGILMPDSSRFLYLQFGSSCYIPRGVSSFPLNFSSL